MARHSSRRAPAHGSWGFVLVNAVFVILGASIAAWSLYPVYGSTRYLATVGVAIALGVVIVLACLLLKRGSGLALILVLVAYVAGGLLLAIPGAVAGVDALVDGAIELARGPVLGWKDIITLPLPLGEYRATLVPIYALFLTASLLATWAATRSKRAWGLGALTLGILLVVTIVIGPATRADALEWAPAQEFVTREFLVGLALFALVLAWFGWRAVWARRRAISHAQGGGTARLVRAPHTRVLGNVVAVMLIVAISVGVGGLAAGTFAANTPREVARSSIDPQLTVASSISPLASYRSYYEDDAYNAVLFTVEVTEGAPDRLRLASLSHFDGETFSATAGPSEQPVRFQRVPSSIAGEGDTVQVAAEVTMGVGGGIWVPLLGELGSVTFHGARQAQLIDGFYYLHDDVAGVTGAEGGIVAGDSYTVRANVPATAPTLADLGAPPGVTTVHRDLIPTVVGDWVTLQGVSRDGAGLEELVSRLRSRGYLSHALDPAEPGTTPNWQAALGDYAFAPAAAGHSYDRIDRLFQELLEREESSGGIPGASLVAAVGDDEQFAAATALIAAELGFPSRVVVGVRLLNTDPEGWAPPPCENGECRGQNLTAWVEVQGANGQWVPVDVTPQYESPLAPELSTQRDPEHATALDPQRAEPIVPPASQRGAVSDAPPVEEDELGGPAWLGLALRIAGISLLALLLLCGPGAAILVWKALRRRKRKSGAPNEVVYGGWEEYVDTAVESGREPLPLATRTEVAREYASPQGSRIALLADRANFSGGSAPQDEAQELWELLNADRATWLAEKGWWARQRMRFSLRSAWHAVATPTPKAPSKSTEQRPRWRSEHTARTGSHRATSKSHHSRRRSRRRKR